MLQYFSPYTLYNNDGSASLEENRISPVVTKDILSLMQPIQRRVLDDRLGIELSWK
jgi:hypothetical protein